MVKERRNKYLMQEAIRAKGIRAVGQKLCRTEQEVSEFLKSLPSPICVVKPNESAGTDSVFLCRGKSGKEGDFDSVLKEALVGFNAIHGKHNGLGQINDGALVQVSLCFS